KGESGAQTPRQIRPTVFCMDEHASADISQMSVPKPTSTPALGLIAGARVEARHVVRLPTHGPREERRDLRLEHDVGGEADAVLEAFGFRALVQVGQGEGCIAAQQASAS